MQVIPATPFSPGVGSLLKLPVNHLSSQTQPFCCCRPATLQVSILRAQNKNKSLCLKEKHSSSQEQRSPAEISNSRKRSPSAYLVLQNHFFLKCHSTRQQRAPLWMCYISAADKKNTYTHTFSHSKYKLGGDKLVQGPLCSRKGRRSL